ncbi:hypothetical protein [Dyella nitratireducens]|uniref:MACPF domain-containing protein n=1 Tax=Dyella nitratireducens TaxID=1849580 RepID=A0ABQ1GCL3_9GAMM|nr:hypothetical protein [Dyella nitratireducens]GGA41182.1 hypothetical protein GCM10010981_32980 [Dyella nitratireducens]GLQ40656.1 hypothetical protein GCM10007902_05050 [Dyella nitratireducens]
MDTILQLGKTANLFFGYRPVWVPAADSLPFFAPPTAAVAPVTVTPVKAPFPEWSATPTITIHESADSLLNTLYAYQVAPMSGDPSGIDVPSGPLALDDADHTAALAALGTFLGLDFSQDRGYMLVTMTRPDSSCTHPFSASPSYLHRSDYLTPEAKAIIDALPPAVAPKTGSVLYDSKISKPDADQYVAALYQLGSHFISEVSSGDMLLQVFAYDATHFESIRSSFKSDATVQPDGSKAVVGPLATAWAFMTSPASGRGYVAAYGALRCLSRDPLLDAAIAKGEWSSLYLPTGKASIFAAANTYKLMLPLVLNVPIAFTLTPIADLIANPLVSGPWDRIVKGGLLQKYGDSVLIPQTRQIDYDWTTIFPEAADTGAGSIITPTIDLYQERIDLAKVNLLGGSIVAENFRMQSFTSFSQVLHTTAGVNSDTLTLPSDQITLIAQIIDMSQAVKTPTLSMSVDGLANLTVVCEEMYGAMVFEAEDTDTLQRKVAMDGILFATDSQLDPNNGRARISVCGVLADNIDPALFGSLKQSIQFSLVAGESLLHSRGPNADTVRELECTYLRWLAGLIPADTHDLDLAEARARALYLANNVATMGGDIIYVPYVTYDSYNKFVGDMIDQARTLTGQISEYQITINNTVNSFKIMDSIANLNDNVKQIGGVLTSYFQVLASGRGAMDGYYNSVLNQLNNQQEQTAKDILSLSKKLADQQAVISHTGSDQGIIQRFQQDYSDYAHDLVAQCVVSAVEGVFSLGLAMAAIPGEAEGGVLKALKSIKDVYDKLQAVMKVLQSLSAVEKAANNIKNLNDLSKDISAATAAGTLDLPSQVDLQALAENVRAALTNVPNTGKLNQDKADLIAAVNTLVNIGTALLEAQTRASQISMQIINQNRLKTINGEQQGKLDALTSMLHLGDSKRAPDINSINLIGLTGQLQYQLKQVLSVLASTLELQDGAIQYEYFGQPTPITSFSLLNLQTVIATQDNAIITALQRLNPPPQEVPKPITIRIPNVLASRVSGSNVFQFPIALCGSEFYSYDMVRIDRVVPRILGIKSSASGNYEARLSCQAKPFQDRDYNRDAYTFATSRREFGPYVYNIATGTAEFGTNTGTFAKQTTHLTPFSTWEISLPSDVRNNQGIEFDSLFVTIEVDFYITAHYDDPALLRRPTLRSPMPQSLKAMVGQINSGSAPTLANLEAQMYQNEAVLQKWDAVFNVLSGPVNAFLYQQFQQYVKQLNPGSSDNLMKVSAYYCENVQQVHGFWFTNVTKMTFKLSNPLLQFVPGNDSVTVVQNILSGSVVVGTLGVTQNGFDPTKCYLVDQDVHFTGSSGQSTLTLSVLGVFENNMQVKLRSTGQLPAPLQADTDYWVVGWTSTATVTSLQLANTAGGAPIALTSAGSGTHTVYADIEWGTPNNVDVSKKPYVNGSVALSKVSGIVTPPPGQGSSSETHTVVLDFPAGAFTLNQFAVDPPNWDPNHHAVQISNALASYYATNDIKYQVQTINYTNLNQDVALQPSKFVLNALTTNAGNNILQILIATTGDVQHAHTITLNEPVPYDPSNPIPGVSDFSVSLMISTKLMFDHIFVSSFNQGGTNLQVKAIDPGKDFKAWSAEVSQGSATGNVDFKNPYTIRGTQTNFRISSSGNSLTWDLTGLKFERSPAAGLVMNYTNGTASPPSGGTNVNFEYQQYYPPVCSRGGCSPGGWGNWHGSSATAYITMTGAYPLEVTGTGRDQLVKFSTVEPSVDFSQSSDLKPTGPCECNDNDLKIALLKSLGDSVPKTLKQYMQQITFKPISVFALENLLFPAEQLITMKQARVPGDLLVVGSFLPNVRKSASSYNVTISASAGAKGVFGTTAFQNGQGTGSATVTGLPKQFQFQYGPINPALGGLVTYTIDIEAGTVSPPLMVVVDQPDPDHNAAQVILLPPGYATS